MIEWGLLVGALVQREPIRVQTETREFVGRLTDLRASPYSEEIGATVVDSEGRVHGFFLDRATVEWA